MKVLAPLLFLLHGDSSLAFVSPKTVVPRSFQLYASTLESPTTTDKTPNPNSPGSKEPTQLEPKVRLESENNRFKCDANVEMWRTLVSQGNDQDLRDLIQILQDNLVSPSSSTPLSRAYFASSGARTVFFGVNGLLSSAIASNGSGGDLRKDIATAFRVLEAVKCYEQELQAIEAGLLKYPWDFPVQPDNRGVQWDHKQMNPLFALSESLTLLREAPSILERRSKFQGKPSGQVWMSSPPPESKGSSMIQYPSYYLNDFHYQTDGWLSSASAKKYEMSSETIFIGTQDVMQRQTLIPLCKHFDTKAPANLLEVACGTGRLSTFVRDHFPTTNVTLTDLSPFYLEKAKENDEYWRQYRGRQAMQESTGTAQDPAPVELLQAAAEQLPFPDNSFEAVMCVYLFHELPGPVRTKAAKEMARVVKPGGMLLFSDSVQVGDRAALPNLEAFTKFNEPHYPDYVRNTDLGQLFEEAGLESDAKYVNSRTKTLSFVKPKNE